MSSVLFTLSNPTSIGVILQIRVLPTVVSSIKTPFSAFSILTFIFASIRVHLYTFFPLEILVNFEFVISLQTFYSYQ